VYVVSLLEGLLKAILEGRLAGDLKRDSQKGRGGVIEGWPVAIYACSNNIQGVILQTRGD